ncbi:hypothetical protein D0T53_09265 [Dysgonomonas sp. 216]|uniref:XkdF-like putative serine protease domain-containing protein n=1 Tax=Dysgonomonas sp. 216 TaxID=2302934 RepID=UPI0013CF541A|nr:XkdF-like putative serine protease domain-containing protein [Dysgonomonas sp. 216]NDW19101.1 hypothetical protein [Dysgonomonas sp. 216]
MNLPVFDCRIDDSVDDKSGIYAISFVESPAVEVEFIALSEHLKDEFLCCDKQKQVLTGVVLRPGQLIYRNDPKQGEHFIRFTETEIEKIARKMMKTGIALRSTTHQHIDTLSGNYLTELWIVEDPEKDKSRALGFEPQPQGTLMCSYKIEDNAYWKNEVMTGNVKGFSIEGLFFRQATDANELNQIKNKKMKQKMSKHQKAGNKSLLSRLGHFLLGVESVEKSDFMASGTAYVVFVLADGKEVLVDSDGFATLEGEQLPAGEHLLADGNILVVDADGQFCETKAVAKKDAENEKQTTPQTLSDDDQKKKATTEESAETLKAKIAELETKLSELATLLKDAALEVQNLRKTTPSSLPVVANLANKRPDDIPRYEEMAQALASAIKNRK